MANGASGLVGGFVVDGSLSKTSVADTAGQRTQMAALVDAVLHPAHDPRPCEPVRKPAHGDPRRGRHRCDGGAGDPRGLKRYYRVNRADWVFFMGAGLGILFFGIIQGIVIGVVLSLLLLIARSSRTSVRRLGYDPDSGAYHALGRSEGLETTPGVLDHPDRRTAVLRRRRPLQDAHAGARKRDGAPASVVIDADAVHLTDTDGADMLIQVAGELRSQGISLALAEVHPPSLALWRRAGLMEALDDDDIFETVDDAVESLAARPARAGRPA